MPLDLHIFNKLSLSAIKMVYVMYWSVATSAVTGFIMNFYYVYVLQSEVDAHLYIGFTHNVRQRLREHNSGKNISTKFRRPFRLIFYEAYCQKSDALRGESYFKTTKGKTTLKVMLRDHFNYN